MSVECIDSLSLVKVLKQKFEINNNILISQLL